MQKDSETRQNIGKLINKSILFENLSEEDFGIVIDAMTLEEIKIGETIIQEGEEGDILYIVYTGEYACSKVINGK